MIDDVRRAALVVDDSEMDRLVLGAILSSEGFLVRYAASGAEAREVAAAHPVDVILLDVVMPDEDGFETCRQLKGDPTTASTPVIFLSSLEDSRSKVKGFAAGAVDYVTKPPDREEVLARVALHIRIHRTFQLHIQEQTEKLARVQAAQLSLLTDPRGVPEARASVFHRSLQEAGGDFYEIIPLGEGVCAYFVADVSGHDLAVSMILSALKALLHQGARLLYTPQECMTAMNAVLARLLGPEQFATAAYVLVNRKRRSITVVNAALPPLLLAAGDGGMEELRVPGDLLGKFESPEFGTTQVSFAPGDRLYICTDGCYESLAAGWDQYAATCVRLRGAALAEAPQAVMAALFPRPEDATDDQLLLVVDA